MPNRININNRETMNIGRIKGLSWWIRLTTLLAVVFIWFELSTMQPQYERLWPAIMNHDILAIMYPLCQIGMNLLGIAIWLASVALRALGLNITKKKAYAFLLTFFLLSTLVAPVKFARQKLAYEQTRNIRGLSANSQPELQQPCQYPLTYTPTININLPIGPLLILLAVWNMIKTDGIKLVTNDRKPDERPDQKQT